MSADIKVTDGTILEALNNKVDIDFDNVASNSVSFARMSREVTNCITEIPQRIKLELTDGVLTLKAGSEVIIPNGFEADGTTPKFDYVTIESDMNFPYQPSISNQVFPVYHVSNNVVSQWLVSNSYSGDTAPTVTSQHNLWYDTKSNKMKHTDDSGVTWTDTRGYCLPLGLATMDAGKYTTINQVFNGMGYIGSTVWVDKGVKGLIPNGRNEDGSLNNTEVTTSKLALHSDSLLDRNWVVQIDEAGFGLVAESNYFEQETEPTGVTGWTVWFNTRENRCYLKEMGNSSSSWTPQYFCNNRCVFTVSNGVITSINIKQPFRAVDYSDGSTVSGWGMPSSKYIDLTFGATGTTYIAPANGWFVLRATATSTYAFMNLSNHNSAIEHIADLTSKDDQCGLFVPAKKGDAVGIWYTNFALTGSTDRFRFVYAEGEI